MKQNLIIAAVMAMMATMATSAIASEQAAHADSKPVEELAAVCAACHGPTGVSPSGAFPIIAGQHVTYLEKAMQDYQSGKRKNPIMSGQVNNLSKADIKALAAYFSKQESPLYTPTGD